VYVAKAHPSEVPTTLKNKVMHWWLNNCAGEPQLTVQEVFVQFNSENTTLLEVLLQSTWSIQNSVPHIL